MLLITFEKWSTSLQTVVIRGSALLSAMLGLAAGGDGPRERLLDGVGTSARKNRKTGAALSATTVVALVLRNEDAAHSIG